ncbi:MAG: polyferredoxin [Candidatus Paceibacteria bacterium]|jgi:polyferredoxin
MGRNCPLTCVRIQTVEFGPASPAGFDLPASSRATPLMPVGKTRDKVLYGIGRKRGKVHRYTWMRWVVAIVSTVVVALLPGLGILRFDLWGGQHVLMGEEVAFAVAAKAFAYPFLGVNIAIVVASRTTGRYLCGFSCPYGAITRLREWIRFRSKEPFPRLLGEVLMFALCGLLGAIVFSFWVSWDVFLEGQTMARAFSLGFLAAMVGGLYMQVRLLGIGFCRGWCPSGVYFALLGPDTVNGIEFKNPDSCTECDACDKACPVDLLPREMSGGRHRDGIGLYTDGMSNFANCLRCGDCVNVCEGMTDRYGKPTPLVMGWLPEAARNSKQPRPKLEGDEPKPVA